MNSFRRGPFSTASASLGIGLLAGSRAQIPTVQYSLDRRSLLSRRVCS